MTHRLRLRLRWLRLELLMRRRIRVVLWGARGPCDLQAGSPDDRARARFLEVVARRDRLQREHLLVTMRVVSNFGASMADVQRRMLKAAAAFGKSMDALLTPEARERIRDAERQRELEELGLHIGAARRLADRVRRGDR